MSCQGISVSDCTTLATASTVDISSYVYEPDTPPALIDSASTLPANLITEINECDGNSNCKLIAYNFNTNTGTKAQNDAQYLLQLSAGATEAYRTNKTVMAMVGTSNVTSLGIPTENLDLHYDPSHIQLTPPITNRPIGFSELQGTFVDTDRVSRMSSGSSNLPSLDQCASSCVNVSGCRGFNYDDVIQYCALFNLVDVEAVLGQATNDNSNTGTTLTLVIKNAISGIAAGQYIIGLDEYINGNIEITSYNAAAPTNIPIKFTEQAVRGIPVNTTFRIKAPTRYNPLDRRKAYANQIDHINNVGVNGTDSYGYSADFITTGTISSLLNPISTTSALTAFTTPQSTLTVQANINALTGSPKISSGVLPINRPGGSACNSGIYDTTNDAILCSCATHSAAVCDVKMSVNSQTGTSITFNLPETADLRSGSASGSPLILTGAIEFTVTLAPTSPVPSQRIIGWTGTVVDSTGLGLRIPVVVKSYTTSTITFTFSATTYSQINAQVITLSDTKGASCQDIKACNASIQRLLDSSGVRSFSTMDLVACSGCNERAYNKPAGTQSAVQFTKLREYLWYENVGVFACPISSLPTGATTRDGNCTPVCTKPDDTYADSAAYDAASSTCRVTCRPGLSWNGTACVPCPAITLPPNISLQPGTFCHSLCIYSSGSDPANMTINTQYDGSTGYTTSCSTSCSVGVPNGDNTRCCPAVTTTTGTIITRYTDDCTTPVCAKSRTDNFIDTVSTSGSTCAVTCDTVTLRNSTSSLRTATDTFETGVVLPVQGVAGGSAFTLTTTTTTDAVSTTDSFPPLSGSSQPFTTLNTNIGSYMFYPQGSHDAVYTGNGTPTPLYAIPNGISTFYIKFPFKIKIESIQFWFTGINNVTINLKSADSTDVVLSQSIPVTTSPYTFTNSVPGYQKRLSLVFNKVGAATIAYKITASVQKICTTMCVPPTPIPVGVSGAYLSTSTVSDPESQKICDVVCSLGYSYSGSGCTACSSVSFDPGTSVSFDSSCTGSCYVFNPQVASSSLVNATAYAGTSSSNPLFIAASATGTARVCHIKSCPPNYTQYTASSGSTLSDSGCCQVPTVVNSSGTVLSATGITWSYPTGTPGAASVSTATCSLSCSLPSLNTYNMSVTPNQTNKTCVRSCPSLTPPAGFTISQADNCQPTCSLSTADPNGYASYASSTCTKSCNSTYYKDTATSACCPYAGAGTNTTVVYGAGSTCNTGDAICSVTTSYPNINKAAYSAPGGASSPACSIQCKTVSLATGTSSSYSTDGRCTLTCSTTITNAVATGTDASGGNSPSCSWACSSGYYTKGSSCCQNVTADTGITVAYNANDCGFTCSTSAANMVVTKNDAARTCTAACASQTYLAGGQCCKNVSYDWNTKVSGSTNTTNCSFTCTGIHQNAIKTDTASDRSCVAGGTADGGYFINSIGEAVLITYTNYADSTKTYDVFAASGGFGVTNKLCTPISNTTNYLRLYIVGSTVYYRVNSSTTCPGGTTSKTPTMYEQVTVAYCPTNYTLYYNGTKWNCTYNGWIQANASSRSTYNDGYTFV